MKIVRLLLVAALMSVSINSLSQRTVSGIVLDCTNDDETIVGARIEEKWAGNYVEPKIVL